MLAVLFAFCLSTVLLICFARLAPRWGFVDKPNARSAHRSPTPVGAGVCFALAATVALFVPGVFPSETHSLLLVLQSCGVVVALVGLMDDRFTLPAGVRLLVYLMASTIAVVTLLGVAPLLLVALAILALGWTINLVNFMDGFDGFVVTQALCVCLGLAIISLFVPEVHGISHLTLVLAAALLPFGWRNWPPASLFMGDSGAVFLGFYLGFVGLYAVGQDHRLGAAWLIVMMPFIVDASCTLMIRLLQGKSPAEAHSDHSYQRLLRATGSPLTVNCGLLVLHALWQFPLALWAVLGAYSQIFAVIFSTIPSLVLVAYSRSKP